MAFPVTANVSDSLKIEIHLHEFFLGDRERRAWTYLTRGMQAVSQQEMALTLLLDDDMDADNFPKTPVKMFQLLHEHATSGRLVQSGDATRLGKRGIFGFPCLFYVPAIQYEDLPNLDEYLSLMLVHQEEYEYAKQYGLTRFLSRIGRFCSSFPYPTWNTQVRPSLFTGEVTELSLLADENHILAEHSYVHLSDGKLQFQLRSEDANELAERLASGGEDEIIVNCGFSPRCDASLYWQEGQVGPGAYAAPATRMQLIGGAFLVIQPGDETDFGIVEDGFYLKLTSSDLEQFAAHITSAESLTLALDERSFILDVMSGSPRPVARAYETTAVWQNIAPAPEAEAEVEEETEDTNDADSAGTDDQDAAAARVTSHPFINLSGENSLAERVSRDKLDDYIAEIHDMLGEALSEESDSFDLTLEITVYPHRVTCEVSGTLDFNPAFSDFIQGAVLDIEPCDVSSQIKFRLPVSVNP